MGLATHSRCIREDSWIRDAFARGTFAASKSSASTSFSSDPTPRRSRSRLSCAASRGVGTPHIDIISGLVSGRS